MEEDRDTFRTSPDKDILTSEMGKKFEEDGNELMLLSLQGTQDFTADSLYVDQ